MEETVLPPDAVAVIAVPAFAGRVPSLAADRELLTAFGKQIGEKILAGDATTPSIPGNRPYCAAGASFVPSTDDTCTDCGQCAELCPAGAKTVPAPVQERISRLLETLAASRKEPELFL